MKKSLVLFTILFTVFLLPQPILAKNSEKSEKQKFQKLENAKERFGNLKQASKLNWNTLSDKQKQKKLETAKKRIEKTVDKAIKIVEKIAAKTSSGEVKAKVQSIISSLQVQKNTIRNSSTPHEFEQAVKNLQSSWTQQKKELLEVMKK